MTERERKMAVLLTSILQGNPTVSQLRRRIADGKAQVEKLGPLRVKRSQLDAIAAYEGRLIARKAGSRILIRIEDAREWLSNLPLARPEAPALGIADKQRT